MLKKIAIALLVVSSLSGCGVRSIPQAKNEAEAALAEISNQYKRRADLVPNLVEMVKGYAKHEKSVLVEVTSARARATAMNIDPSNTSPEQLSAYNRAQGQLGMALGRLLAVSENYPTLKASDNFRDLQSQLEGTENRCAIARQRYIEAVKNFNNEITVFPGNFTNKFFYKYGKLAQWELDMPEKKAVEKAPTVKF